MKEWENQKKNCIKINMKKTTDFLLVPTKRQDRLKMSKVHRKSSQNSQLPSRTLEKTDFEHHVSQDGQIPSLHVLNSQLNNMNMADEFELENQDEVASNMPSKGKDKSDHSQEEDDEEFQEKDTETENDEIEGVYVDDEEIKIPTSKEPEKHPAPPKPDIKAVKAASARRGSATFNYMDFQNLQKPPEVIKQQNEFAAAVELARKAAVERDAQEQNFDEDDDDDDDESIDGKFLHLPSHKKTDAYNRSLDGTPPKKKDGSEKRKGKFSVVNDKFRASQRKLKATGVQLLRHSQGYGGNVNVASNKKLQSPEIDAYLGKPPSTARPISSRIHHQGSLTMRQGVPFMETQSPEFLKNNYKTVVPVKKPRALQARMRGFQQPLSIAEPYASQIHEAYKQVDPKHFRTVATSKLLSPERATSAKSRRSIICNPNQNQKILSTERSMNKTQHLVSTMSPHSMDLLSSLKIINDPDKLKEYIFQIKETSTRQEIENIQLKTKMTILRREMAQREKIINDMMQAQQITMSSSILTKSTASTNANKDIILCFKLKNQLRNVYDLLKERDLEIDQYKKTLKLTKLEESEKELETIYTEAARLRRLLEDSERTVQRLIKQRNLHRKKKQSNNPVRVFNCTSQPQPINNNGDYVDGQYVGLNNSYQDMLNGVVGQQPAQQQQIQPIQQFHNRHSPSKQNLGVPSSPIKSKNVHESHQQMQELRKINVDLSQKIENQVIEIRAYQSKLKKLIEKQTKESQTQQDKILGLQNKVKETERLMDQLKKKHLAKEQEWKKQLIEESVKWELKLRQAQEKIWLQSHNFETQMKQVDSSGHDTKKDESDSNTSPGTNKSPTQPAGRGMVLPSGAVAGGPPPPRKSIANSFNRIATILEIPASLYQRTNLANKNSALKDMVNDKMIQEQIQRIRWTLLMDRMPSDEVNRLLFDQYSSDHGEETSIKDLQNILFTKFGCLTKDDSLQVARFLIEVESEIHPGKVIFTVEAKMQNRKITSLFTDRILGPGYEAISEREEIERVEKLRMQVKGHGLTPQDVENALDLYDPDERGYITMKDLHEWLESLELIKDDDEEDKLLQIIIMYVYKKTKMASQELRTFHLLKLIFPDYMIENATHGKMMPQAVNGDAGQSAQQKANALFKAALREDSDIQESEGQSKSDSESASLNQSDLGQPSQARSDPFAEKSGSNESISLPKLQPPTIIAPAKQNSVANPALSIQRSIQKPQQPITQTQQRMQTIQKNNLDSIHKSQTQNNQSVNFKTSSVQKKQGHHKQSPSQQFNPSISQRNDTSTYRPMPSIAKNGSIMVPQQSSHLISLQRPSVKKTLKQINQESATEYITRMMDKVHFDEATPKEGPSKRITPNASSSIASEHISSTSHNVRGEPPKIEYEYDEEEVQQDQLLQQQNPSNAEVTTYEEMDMTTINLSEEAFKMISEQLLMREISLRMAIQSEITHIKVRIEQTTPMKPGTDMQQQDQDDLYEDIEAIEVERFFDSIFELIQVQLNDDQIGAIIRVAGRHVQNGSDLSTTASVVFIYKDLEIILSAYGFNDSTRPPQSTENLHYHLLDLKSIRIMNRLVIFMHEQGFESIKSFVDQAKVYTKDIKHEHGGSESQLNIDPVNLEFVRTNHFFKKLQELQIRISAKPHDRLVQFLSVDHNLYNQGLVIKKIDKLIKECTQNEYFHSVGMQKRKLGAYNNIIETQDMGQQQHLQTGEIQVINDYTASEGEEDSPMQ